VNERGFVGLSLAIMRDGKIVLAKGYGKSSLATGADVTPDTAFGIGSISKQFTCALALLLAEDKKLSMEDKVAKYYPKLTRAKDITLYDLLTHQSGYRDYYPLDFVSSHMYKPIEQDALLDAYAGRSLDFEPRTRWSYSNTGFILAGRIIEKASGQRFEELVKRRIFEPLKMEHSFSEAKPGGPGFAMGHTSFALGEREVAAPEGKGWLGAAGGLFATASDLAKWDLALAEGKILKESSLKLMTAPRALADGTPVAYGCGIGSSERRGERLLQHTGAVSGFFSANGMVPRSRSAVVLLSNTDDKSLESLYETLLSLLIADLHKPTPVPPVAGPTPNEIVLTLIHQFQAGKLDKTLLGDDYAGYMQDAKVQGAAARWKALGEPLKIEINSLRERGGMEVAGIRVVFKTTEMNGMLYRTPDGKVQQLLFYR
jgi:D-alanyl-D-alanine carboxypeptidase